MTGGAVEIVLFVVLTWFLFVGWIVIVIVRTVYRGVRKVVNPAPRPARIAAMQCTHLRCGAMNPPQAQYCRRCGSPLSQTARLNSGAAA